MPTTYEFDVSISSAVSTANGQDATAVGPLSPTQLSQMQRYWQAVNYLTVAQIYLRDNALLREPLQADHIKPRLLGHWGTSPGLSLIYVHLNRLIKERDANVIYLAGPGHGGPALVAHAYLEHTQTGIGRDEQTCYHADSTHAPHCRQ
jgi:xylulose-5-phosphate/fructose-6-phosphate phosphoketolase